MNLPNNIKLHKIVLSQDPDCCSDDEQFLEMSIEDGGGGGGPFYVIKTERWAFDSIDEIITCLKSIEILNEKEDN